MPEEDVDIELIIEPDGVDAVRRMLEGLGWRAYNRPGSQNQNRWWGRHIHHMGSVTGRMHVAAPNYEEQARSYQVQQVILDEALSTGDDNEEWHEKYNALEDIQERWNWAEARVARHDGTGKYWSKTFAYMMERPADSGWNLESPSPEEGFVTWGPLDGLAFKMRFEREYPNRLQGKSHP